MRSLGDIVTPNSLLNIICATVITAEMLIVNLISLDICCKRKFSKWLTYFACLLFGAIVGVVGYFIFPVTFEKFTHGRGLFLLLGWSYVLPCALFYKESLLRLISVMSTSWIYTFSVFALSVAVSLSFPNVSTLLFVAIMQTVLLLATSYPIITLLKRNYLPVLSSIGNRTNKLLLMGSLMWFALAFLGNLSILSSASKAYPIVMTLLYIATTGYTFYLIYQVTIHKKDIENLHNFAYMDQLTQVGNRLAFFGDGNKLIEEGKPFSLIYSDLNNLKSVNDSHGHLYGDKYIANIAKFATDALSEDGKFYRISGDEFVCLFYGTDYARSLFINKLIDKLWNKDTVGMEYLGSGVGYAVYPSEEMTLDRLLWLADKRMYMVKHEGTIIEDNTEEKK